MGILETIHINEPESRCLVLFRAALSERTHHDRMKAIGVMRHEVVNHGLSWISKWGQGAWQSENASNFDQWVMETSAERHDAVHEYHEIMARYDRKNERKLNVAEHIGKLVWLSIQDQRFQGLHVPGGLLEQVGDEARTFGIAGAKDKDTLRKIWNDYRGVAHLGMAMDYCEDNPDANLNVLHVAERFRKELSQSCPRGTSKPYVDPGEQLSFLYISKA